MLLSLLLNPLIISSINHLVKASADCNKFPEATVTFSNVFIFLTNSPKPKKIYFITKDDRDRQKILTFGLELIIFC